MFTTHLRQEATPCAGGAVGIGIFIAIELAFLAWLSGDDADFRTAVDTI